MVRFEKFKNLHPQENKTVMVTGIIIHLEWKDGPYLEHCNH